MNAMKVNIDEKVQVLDEIELIDCGCASEQTKGTHVLLFLENSLPPFDWLYL